MENKSHIQKIDFLRGIAILFVFAYHYEILCFPYYAVPGPDFHPAASRFLLFNFLPAALGWSGVAIFLIISGFLIHRGYLKDPDGFSIRDFYSKRFWRIYPPYLLILFLFSLLPGQGIYTTRAGLVSLFLHIFSLHNLFDRTYFGINPSFWSLALEVQLYLLYPLFLSIRKKVGIRLTLGLTLLLSVLLLSTGQRFNNFGTAWSWSNSVLALWFIWASGAWLAEVTAGGKKMISGRGMTIAPVVFLLLFVAGYFLHSLYLFEYAATAGWVFFIDWLLRNEKIRFQGRGAKVVLLLGLCSYSMYLLHQPLLGLVFELAYKSPVRYPGERFLNILPAFLLIFLLSYLLYRCIELPSIQAGKKQRGRRNNPPARLPTI